MESNTLRNVTADWQKNKNFVYKFRITGKNNNVANAIGKHMMIYNGVNCHVFFNALQ